MQFVYIDDRKLNHFVAAAETGSLLSAAERVRISQPALSRSVRALEKAVGVPLLERHPRGVRPTIYGEVLLRHARLLRNQTRLAVDELEALRDGREGHLRIGVAPSFHRILPRAVASLLASHPSLTCELLEGTYDVVAERVLAGELEAAFTLFPLGEQSTGLTHQPLLRSEFTVVLGKRHALAGRRRVGLGDLAAVPWVMVSRPQSLVTGIRQVFFAAGISPPVQAVETDSIPTVKELLHSGAFVALLPREIVDGELRSGDFAAIPIPEMPQAGVAGMVTREGAVLPAALDLLVAAIGEDLGPR